MKAIRPIFFMFFAGLSGLLALYAAIQLVRGMHPAMSWWGLLLTAGAPAWYFLAAFIRSREESQHRPVGISVLCGLGVAITMAMSWRHGTAAGIVHLWAGACLIGWFVYLRWFSAFAKDKPQASPGTGDN